uniref:Plectrovirus spv1-r8a2b orf 14 protein n=1 Tax=Spiroplasma citri TaxID=2133 RepID=Q14KU4_SPICI|nr:plectrovirus spv1-r8a2b orf 14 protein [Spiroplasma citri]
MASCNRSATNQFWKELIFYWKETLFFLRSLVTKYGKDIVINTVNKIVINNLKENE